MRYYLFYFWYINLIFMYANASIVILNVLNYYEYLKNSVPALSAQLLAASGPINKRDPMPCAKWDQSHLSLEQTRQVSIDTRRKMADIALSTQHTGSGRLKHMNYSRRVVLAALCVTVFLCNGTLRAQQGYPTKPVKIVMAWPPGASADTGARLVAHKLGESMGQTFLVENRSGASGIVGAEVVARAAPDGYTLLFSTSTHASNKAVVPKLSYDPIADFAPVSLVQRTVLSIAVNPSLPVQTLAEFLQYAMAKPGALSFGSSGLGSPHQLAGELLKLRAGIDMVHIPYKGGGPAVADLISGQIPVSMSSLAAVIPFMGSARVRVIAITDPSRYEELPDVPAVAETIPGFDVSGWSAMFAPAGTPAEIVNRLNVEITRILKMPDIRRTMSAAGLVASVSTPEQLAKLVRSDIEAWALIIKSGVKFK